MNVYEVEIATDPIKAPGFRFNQHVRAASEDEARAKVQAAQGPDAKLLEVSIRRPCTDAEIAEELAR